MVKGKDNKMKHLLQDTTNQAMSAQAMEGNDEITETALEEEEEFQLLNALEIFWNINSDNIELLKENWGCKCASCKSENTQKEPDNFIDILDFHVYEVKKVIQGDVLTIKPDYFEHILQICKGINPNFINGSMKDLPLFDSAENMHKYLNSMVKPDKIQSWKDFEIQLTKIIEYKVSIMYFAVSNHINFTFRTNNIN